MTAKKERNYNESEAKNEHGQNEEAIGEEPIQPSFLVYKSIPVDKMKICLKQCL